MRFLQGDENRFDPMCIQFNAELGARPKQANTIAIQRRIDDLKGRYYECLMPPMEHLHALSFAVDRLTT